MKKHPVDELFSRKLRDAEITPRDEAFQKFQQRLQTKERRIGWWQQGPWLAAAGVSLLLMAGGGWWLMSQPSDTTVALSGTTAKKATAPPTKVIESSPIKTALPQALASNEVMPQATNKTTVAPTVPKAVAKAPVKMREETKLEQLPPMQESQIAQVATTPTAAPQHSVKVEDAVKSTTLTNAVAEVAKPVEKTVVLQLPALKENTQSKEALVASKEVETNSSVSVPSSETDLLNQPRKSTRMAKVWQQLKNAKNGEKVDWDEVGFNPNKLVAKAIGK